MDGTKRRVSTKMQCHFFFPILISILSMLIVKGCQMDRKLSNELGLLFLSSWVLPDDICNEILVLKVDATETEAYLAPCLNKQRDLPNLSRMTLPEASFSEGLSMTQ